MGDLLEDWRLANVVSFFRKRCKEKPGNYERVVDIWNVLPEKAVDTGTLATFKQHLNEYLKYQAIAGYGPGAEPLLQWELGVHVEVADIFPFLQLAHTLIIVRRLCASDMAIIAPVFSRHELPNSGLYLLVTKSAFNSNNEKWYDVKPKLCTILNGDCENIALRNIVLTNRHVILLTTHGLFVSHNLLDVGENPKPGRQIEYYRSKLLPSPGQSSSTSGSERVRLWFTHYCFTENTDNPADFLSLTMTTFTFTSELRKINTCFYGTSPFKEWKMCSPPHTEYIPDIITALWDQQRNTLIILSYLALSSKFRAKVTLRKFNEDFTLRKMKAFPEFYFSDEHFLPNGMFMYPNTYTVYVFGSQVWFSNDGGISFELLLKLKNDFVEKIITCPRNNAVIFITILQNVYYTRPGLARYASLRIFKEGLSTLHCDHLGMLMKITLLENSPTGLKIHFLDLLDLISEDDASFSRPLALQFLTSTKAMFFEYISWIENEEGARPMFSNYHIGKMLQQRLWF
ncbi:cation channel sperm-associated auxiliary subunit beta-like [Stegostoma tigrinum]|uniref:cation channel sperm-associated auxiliary subunit beta-like n=1 Tax=Stegostoma tigrinum TaxID=3053191 RepID=UPI00286FEEFF|nr:cation channel sperm-associated auxiliary subunit beta-like [Stegostoma tigrinum]